MVPEDSVLCSQEPQSGPYAEAGKSNSCLHIPVLYGIFEYYSPKKYLHEKGKVYLKITF
jgi:hypothetical protein